MQCAQDLEDIAYATSRRNRVHGSEGHHNSVKYFVEQLESVGDYYDIELQEFTTEATQQSVNALSVNGEALEAEILSAPEPEVRALVADAAGEAEALRRLVLRAVDRAEEGLSLPPTPAGGLPVLRRP